MLALKINDASSSRQQSYRPQPQQRDSSVKAASITHSPDESTLPGRYALDPVRDPALIVRANAPFNAEPPPELLLKSFVTPNELFFVRNHLPVPDIQDADAFAVKLSGVGLTQEMALTLDELKRTFKHKTVTVTIQCAGNRRAEMSQVKNVRGLVWEKTAISTAKWTGVLLADVLQHFGISDQNEVCPVHGDDMEREDTDDNGNDNDSNERFQSCASCEAIIRHVHFEALDADSADGKRYGASIPISTALDPRKDVLLAFEMNGEPLPRDHGFPLRVIVPGTVGARNVKFLHRIVLSGDESSNFWQQKDYRGFPPNVDYDTDNYFAFAGEAIQELPVQSAIVQPNDGATHVVTHDDKDATIAVQGYAWSGGGRNIVRVDVSTDAGRTWTAATLHPTAKKQRYNRAWAWTPWELDVVVPRGATELEIICKAVDASYNAQPDTIAPIWNMRGMLNNAWHRVRIDVVTCAATSEASLGKEEPTW